MAIQCKFVKDDGTQCGAYAMNGSDYCFAHDPEKKEEKALASKRGGLNRRQPNLLSLKKVRMNEAKDIKRLMGKLINEVRQGDIDARDASCIGYLAGVFLRADEISGLESRLEKIEYIISKLITGDIRYE